MLKRFLPDDLGSSIRSNAIGIMIFVGACGAFMAASFLVMNALEDEYSKMSSSSWVSSVGNLGERHNDNPAHRYDVSEKGVYIPPARDDRLREANGKNRASSSEYYRRDCYEKPNTLEESDLCAQWSGAAAVRYGNRIALESFKLNSWIGFISAFGALLAAIGVLLASFASISASRSVSMMAYGFMPTLAFSVRPWKAGWIRVTVRNVGTGPASDIRVTINGASAKLRLDRLGAGTDTVVEHQISRNVDVVEVQAQCLDLARKGRSSEQRFVRIDSEWLLADTQPEGE